MPIHSRRPTLKPKKRSGMTPSSTKPLASTAWTSDSGASFSDVTCSSHATRATAKPIDHHFLLNSPWTVRSGFRMSTSGASVAPRCRIKKPMSVASADSAATPSPITKVTRALPLNLAVSPWLGVPISGDAKHPGEKGLLKGLQFGAHASLLRAELALEALDLAAAGSDELELVGDMDERLLEDAPLL